MGVTDKHTLFTTKKKKVFQCLFNWDPLNKSFDPLCVLSLASCYQVLVWHHCRQVFPIAQRHSPVLLSCQRVTCSTIPVFSAGHCVLPVLSVVATGFPGHAGGWHLRKKKCVVLLYVSSIRFFLWWHLPSGLRLFVSKFSSSGAEM